MLRGGRLQHEQHTVHPRGGAHHALIKLRTRQRMHVAVQGNDLGLVDRPHEAAEPHLRGGGEQPEREEGRDNEE